MAQQFCLKWNNYQSNMSEVFVNMLMAEEMVDVTIACEGSTLKAHKMVLSACSPFFHAIFLQNPCKHPVVILKDVRLIDMKSIIDFMYRGEVNVSQEQLSALLKTAETLKVKGLAEVTEKQARGQPQLQSALFGLGTAATASARKKRKRGKKGALSKDTISGESSDSDEENTTPTAKRQLEARSGALRQQQHRLISNQVLDKNPEHIESSRILERSLQTAEVVGAEHNGQDSVLASGSDVQGGLADEDTMHRAMLFEEGMGLTSGSQGDGLVALSGTQPQANTLQLIVFGQGSGASNAPNAIAKVNRIQSSKFECTTCKLKFASNYNLKRHLRIHDQERPRWQCEYCDKSFTRRDSLPKHVNFVHKEQAGSKDGLPPDSPHSEPT